jgi:hypothetical protein
VHVSQLRDWVKKFADDPQHAFPSNGQMKPEQLEIASLRREVIKLKAERDILKTAAAREGIGAKCGCIAKRRGIWPDHGIHLGLDRRRIGSMWRL